MAEVGLERRWLPILATQDLAVGVKRIAFTLDGLGASEEEPQVRTSLFRLDGSEEDRERPHAGAVRALHPPQRGR